MSTTDLYRVYRTTATPIAEFRNGWGSAPVIWGYLNQRYLGGDRFNWGLGRDCEPLWNLAKDERVPRAIRLVHAFTFDNALCPVDRTHELADACDDAGKLCDMPSHVNHWAAIAAALREHKPRSRQIGVALSCTSVSDPWIDYHGSDKLWSVFAVVEHPTQLKP